MRLTTHQQQLFHRAIELFNGEEFWEAHEAWEEIWLDLTSRHRGYVQGLIQLAAGFHQWQRGKWHGAYRNLDKAVPRLTAWARESDEVAGKILPTVRRARLTAHRVSRGHEEPPSPEYTRYPIQLDLAREVHRPLEEPPSEVGPEGHVIFELFSLLPITQVLLTLSNTYRLFFPVAPLIEKHRRRTIEIWNKSLPYLGDISGLTWFTSPPAQPAFPPDSREDTWRVTRLRLQTLATAPHYFQPSTLTRDVVMGHFLGYLTNSEGKKLTSSRGSFRQLYPALLSRHLAELLAEFLWKRAYVRACQVDVDNSRLAPSLVKWTHLFVEGTDLARDEPVHLSSWLDQWRSSATVAEQIAKNTWIGKGLEKVTNDIDLF